MKKLIMLSMFALGTITASAGNGEKEISSQKFTEKTIENRSGEDVEDYFITHKKYRIEVWFYISDGEHATSYGQVIIPESQCLDDTNVEILRASIESAYQAMNPGSNVAAQAVYLEDCW